MSADSPRRHPSGVVGSGIGSGSGSGSGLGSASAGSSKSGTAVPAIVPPQTVSDRSILDSAIGFINDVTLANQPVQDPKDTITWARFETCADVSDPRFGDDWELEGNAAPPLLLILGYGLGVQVWAIPANGEAVEVLSWRHGVVTALRVLPTPATAAALDENGRADEPVDAFAEKRPLVAFVDGGSAAASGLLAGNPGLGLGSGGGGGSGVTIVGGSGGGVGGIGVSAAAQFSAVNFMSLKTGVQVKTIKFKNAVLDIQANRSAVVITFHERIAVFDARTLEDRLTITTCYPSPGINPNPIALGPRWLAYAEHKLLHSKRSGGGCDGEGVPSYTATVLNAAKSLGKGLRELGEQVAAGLTGTTAGSGASSKSSSFDSASGGPDAKQSGVVTIIDVKHPVKDYSPTSGTPLSSTGGSQGGGDPIVAHFVAHSEALVAMEFDSSGMLLLTADRRGHDFHVFRVQPHPVGPSLAAVHHLYVLHRGDTSAKVQHIAFSLDSRWAAVSTLRGTTHVFPITPYGGAMGVRTHTSLHVVNKLSRFHRSAGLGADGRSSSPISHSESTTFVQSLQPYHNPTLPPYPRPSVVQPLAQLRQPFTLGSPPGSAGLGGGVGGGVGMSTGVSSVGHGGVGVGSNSQRQRQRLSSLSDDSGKPLSVCSIFAKSRSWLLEPPMATREQPHRVQRKAVDSLFVMAGHGALIQYDLDTKLASHVAKEKICDDTPIELEVEARAQWNLGRRKDGSQEIAPPLTLDNWLIKDRHGSLLLDSTHHFDEPDERAESWLAQVEIITHAGPHRRLWMGPQFVFKNYNTPSGSNLNHVDAEAVEIGVTKTSTTTLPSTAAASSALAVGSAGGKDRSSPLNMPLNAGTSVGGTGIGSSAVTGRSGAGVPVLIESGSYSSIEQSPKLMDRFRHGHLDSDYGHGDTRLKEDLADAMRESPSTAAARRETTAASADHAAPPCGDHLATGSLPTSSDLLAAGGGSSSSNCDNACYYDALAEHESLNDLDEAAEDHHHHQHPDTDTHLHSMDSINALASVLPNICSYSRVEKMVNPLGTVTDLNAGISGELQTDMLDEVVGQLAAEETVIHENCDEALFRPVVAIFCSDPVERQKLLQNKQPKTDEAMASELELEQASCQPPVVLVNKLIVPVIAKEVDEVLVQKEKQKSQKQSHKAQQQQHQQQQQQQKNLRSLAAAEDAAQAQKFAELSHLNKPKGNTNNNNNKTASQKSGSGTSEDDATTATIVKSAKKAKSNKQKTSGKASERKPEQEMVVMEKEEVKKDQEEELSEPESDHADSLLANKSSIAAVMVSSASAQGLSLHVEMSAPDAQDEDEEEEERELDPEKEPPKTAKKKQQPGGAVATMTIDKENEKEKAKEKELKLKEKEKEREAKLKEKEKEERLKLKEREDRIKEKEREEKLKEEKIKEKQREEKLKEEKLKEKEREEKIKEKEREEKIKEKEREEKIKEKEREERIKEKEREEKLKEKLREEKLKEEKIKEKEREEKLKEKERAEKIKEKEREDKLKEKEREEKIKEKEEQLKKKEREEKQKEKEREEKLKEKERQEKLREKEREEKLKKEMEEKLKEREREEKLKEREREEKLKEKEKAEKLKDLEREAKLKEKEREAKLKEKAEKEKMKEKEKSLESIPAAVTSPWRRVTDETPPKLPAVHDYPSLGKKPTKASPEKKRDEKLLPGLTTPPKEVKDTFEDFLSGLKPLEALPPLPALEPLEVKDDSKKEAVSLINFESPLQEKSAIPRNISPPPRGFTEQNLILALCGSLHYENEQDRVRDADPEAQTEVVDTPEPVYITLDTLSLQKSTSTSNNSSGSEEIVIMEEPVKKLSKKHKRLKQLQLQQQQQQRERERDREPDDEELRPLISISMCDSQLEVQEQEQEQPAARPVPDEAEEGVEKTEPEPQPEQEPEQSLPEDLLHFGSSGVATNATNTDSEGPVPATTSDDNLIYGSSSTTNAAPHKLKTKKLEHKINLIAAIEAATSSSTSSAEESSVETTVHPTDPTGLGLGLGMQSLSPSGSTGSGNLGATGAATPAALTAAGGVNSMGLGVGVASPPSATKKKTKRRKR
ncbi:hypothetical protein KR084_012775 [Drosophila pseudotakahashii]|nr:hypothetical protein KR084_012775 [Drosophila pseudotakahashii]